jgi:flagellar hook-associated protein 2
MATISSPGIGSGLDVTSIVTGLVNSERVPFEARIAEQEQEATEKITALGSLVSAVSAFRDAARKLNNASLFDVNKVIGGGTNFNVSANSTASKGSYSIEVVELAQGQKLTSGAYQSGDSVGTGTMTIDVNGSTMELTLTGTETLSDLKKLINDAEDNPGVNASIVTDDLGQRLILTSKEVGLDNAIKISVADTDGNNTDGTGLSAFAYDPDAVDGLGNPAPIANMTETQAAKDAQIIIDGALTVTQSSNVFKDAIEGVTITATKKNEPGETNTITISQDTSKVGSALADFAAAYNTFLETSVSLSRVNTDSKVVGPLAGDSIVRTLTSQVRNVLSQTIDAKGGVNSLASLGMTTNREGLLEVNEATLAGQVNSNFDDVKELFVGSGGIMKELTESLNGYAGGAGTIQAKINGYKSTLDRLDDEKAKFKERMESLEARLYTQFNAMDLLVGQLNSTGSYLQAQLDNLPGVVRKEK